jgi:hypothetical protein
MKGDRAFMMRRAPVKEYDARRLADTVDEHMNLMNIRQIDMIAPTVRVPDSAWNNNGTFLYLEEKTERESMNMNRWWNNSDDTLDGLRIHIERNHNDICCLVKHQNKWIIALAQLCCAIRNLRNIERPYHAGLVLPRNEQHNFQISFERWIADQELNPDRLNNVEIIIWPEEFGYVDQRNVFVPVIIAEINSDTFFDRLIDDLPLNLANDRIENHSNTLI